MDQWKKAEAKNIEEQNRPRDINISQDHSLGETQYAESQRQLEFNDHTMALCCLEALNAWGNVE